MRRKIPRYVNVLLKQTQIEAPAIDVADVAEIARLHDFYNLSDRRRIKKGVVNHQDQAIAIRYLNQLLTFRGRRGHRFFYEGMLARQQASLGQRKVILYRRRDYNRIQPGAAQKLVHARHPFNVWIERDEVLQSGFADIANGLEPAVREALKVADQERAPISASEYAH